MTLFVVDYYFGEKASWSIIVEHHWNNCLERLKDEFGEQFNTWIRPLQAEYKEDKFFLFAPNQFVREWVDERYRERIQEILIEACEKKDLVVIVTIGTKIASNIKPIALDSKKITGSEIQVNTSYSASTSNFQFNNNISRLFTFDNFVVGNSNNFACAAAIQVAENPGRAYNPMFIYGGVGLGKTHLMHAVGNLILKNNNTAKVLYSHSERFVSDMVKAIQTNTINDFKRLYRDVGALLIDDIQFFAGKDRTQEEFFHTFNSLLEREVQIILTCDRYPKEINGVEERLKSRFGWGLTVAIEPPELETRVAILMSKAEQYKLSLPYEVAFFIAKKIRSNVRELEGALKRVIANAHFTGKAVTIDFVREALKDLLSLQDKLISIENIIKTVAEYYKVKVADLLSPRRSRSVARPRQLAMALAKELTNHSLPEIGAAFGGRDHTTVLHACRKINELKEHNHDLLEDYTILLRMLTT